MQVDKHRLRKLLMIEDNEYPRTSNFRMRVVDDPVQEINEAYIGIRIKVDYEYKGRELHAFWFHVERIGHDDPKPRNPATQGELDQEPWMEANPKAWEERLELARGQGDLFDEKSSLDRLCLEGEAWKHFVNRIKAGGLQKPAKENKRPSSRSSCSVALAKAMVTMRTGSAADSWSSSESLSL